MLVRPSDSPCPRNERKVNQSNQCTLCYSQRPRYAAIASRRRRVTAGPNTLMTTNTISIAPAMKLNTPMVP